MTRGVTGGTRRRAAASPSTCFLTVVGKDPAATNYYAGLDVFYFER